MFPIAFAAGSIHDRTLKEDDIAGITDIYPSMQSRRTRGSISGKVTKNGSGVLAARTWWRSIRAPALWSADSR